MSWPDDGEPRFVVTSVTGFTLDPSVGGWSTSKYNRPPISYLVVDRAYAGALIREFPPKRGGSNLEGGANTRGYRLGLAQALATDLNEQDAAGLLTEDAA